MFAVVTLSSVIQTGWFKFTRIRTGTGRRVFRMAPFHHHFELGGWDEITTIIRFWIVGGMAVAFGMGLFYAEFISHGWLDFWFASTVEVLSRVLTGYDSGMRHRAGRAQWGITALHTDSVRRCWSQPTFDDTPALPEGAEIPRARLSQPPAEAWRPWSSRPGCHRQYPLLVAAGQRAACPSSVNSNSPGGYMRRTTAAMAAGDRHQWQDHDRPDARSHVACTPVCARLRSATSAYRSSMPCWLTRPIRCWRWRPPVSNCTSATIVASAGWRVAESGRRPSRLARLDVVPTWPSKDQGLGGQLRHRQRRRPWLVRSRLGDGPSERLDQCSPWGRARTVGQYGVTHGRS